MRRMELTYLGVAGWRFQIGGSSLLIDPYFTRLPLWRILVGRAIPDHDLIKRHTPSADAILISHPHYDHLMDAPLAAQLSEARVYASPQGCDLLGILGLPAGPICPIQPGDVFSVGRFRVAVHESGHRRIFGRIPFRGPLRPGLRPPLAARDYRMDRQYSFLIECGRMRVLVASGIDEEPPIRADVLLIGADAQPENLARILAAVQPQIVFPNHWDDMFRPLSKPTRPMLVPPRGLIPSLRRIDLAAFSTRVRTICPETRVIMPTLFAPYS